MNVTPLTFHTDDALPAAMRDAERAGLATRTPFAWDSRTADRAVIVLTPEDAALTDGALADTPYGVRVRDLTTGLYLDYRRAACGLGCRCAAEIRVSEVPWNDAADLARANVDAANAMFRKAGDPAPGDTRRAAALLAGVLGDSMLMGVIGPRLTCGETDDLALALALLGQDEAAAQLIKSHADTRTEESDDAHGDLAVILTGPDDDTVTDPYEARAMEADAWAENYVAGLTGARTA